MSLTIGIFNNIKSLDKFSRLLVESDVLAFFEELT